MWASLSEVKSRGHDSYYVLLMYLWIVSDCRIPFLFFYVHHNPVLTALTMSHGWLLCILIPTIFYLLFLWFMGHLAICPSNFFFMVNLISLFLPNNLRLNQVVDCWRCSLCHLISVYYTPALFYLAHFINVLFWVKFTCPSQPWIPEFLPLPSKFWSYICASLYLSTLII